MSRYSGPAFPISEATAIRHPGPPPTETDVVVIGGGIIGVMTAWHLAERGLRVVVCEKGRIAGEQSSRNWGWVRQQGRDPGELPIMVESLALWKGLAEEFGEALGFRQEGVLYLARSEAEMAEYEAFLPHARANAVDTVMLDKAGLQARTGLSGPWIGGQFTASDARAEPWAAVPLLAQGAARRGAVLVEGCAVRGLDLAAGRIAGVVTEAGRIACSQVVVAGGAWSSLFLRAQGVAIPQLLVRSTVAQTAPMPEVFAGNAADDRFAFRRRADGGYTIAPAQRHDFFIGPDAFRNFFTYLPVLKRDFRSTSFHPAAPSGFPDAWGTARRWALDRISPFERVRVLNPAPSDRFLREMVADFAEALPQIGRPVVQSAWAGMIDTLPDVVPVVDRVPAIPGLVIATGMCGHGFGIGPGMGRVVADLVAGNATGHDLSRFRLSRFSDGSKLNIGGGL